MMLFIGADNELPLIEWRDNENQPICLHKLDYSDDDVKFADSQLTKKHKYFIGSWQGCGCGFRFDFLEGLNELSKYSELDKQQIEAEFKCSMDDFIFGRDKKGKQSLDSLFYYIRNNASGDDCELLSFLSGEYKIEHNTIINLKEFTLGDSFTFLEGQFITVYK